MLDKMDPNFKILLLLNLSHSLPTIKTVIIEKKVATEVIIPNDKYPPIIRKMNIGHMTAPAAFSAPLPMKTTKFFKEDALNIFLKEIFCLACISLE